MSPAVQREKICTFSTKGEKKQVVALFTFLERDQAKTRSCVKLLRCTTYLQFRWKCGSGTRNSLFIRHTQLYFVTI